MKSTINKKAQAALEFLTTYGWAILVVMVAISALAYFGVLNPSKSLPGRCLFGNGLSCNDQQLNESVVKISLQNGLGTTLHSVYANMTDPVGTCVPSSIATVSADSNVRFNCTITSSTNYFTKGDKGKAKITITFKKVQNGYNQVSLGEVYDTIQ